MISKKKITKIIPNIKLLKNKLKKKKKKKQVIQNYMFIIVKKILQIV